MEGWIVCNDCISRFRVDVGEEEVGKLSKDSSWLRGTIGKGMLSVEIVGLAWIDLKGYTSHETSHSLKVGKLSKDCFFLE